LRIIDSRHSSLVLALVLAPALLLAPAGCSEETAPAANYPDAAPPVDVSPFVGSWVVSTGNAQATMCTDLGDLPMQSLDGTMVTVKADKDAVILLTVGGCTFTFDVKGNVATARPTQSCMTQFSLAGVSIPVTLTIDMATFTVSGGVGTLVQMGHASATMPMATCTYKVTAMGVKATPTDAAAPADAGGGADAGATADSGAPAGDGPTATSDGP
jgi:hypothetical protein